MDKFHPRFFFVPQTVGSTINSFINNQIINLNFALLELINIFIHPTIQIVTPCFNLPFKNFCKDDTHFFFYDKYNFACYLTRMFDFLTSLLLK